MSETPRCPIPDELLEPPYDELDFLAPRKRARQIMILIAALVALLCFGVYGCLRNPVLRHGDAPSDAQVKIDVAALYNHVKALTTTDGHRHHDNLKALAQAAGYIKKEWKAMGLSPVSQTFKAGDQREYENVIVRVGPMGAPKIVVGAHYDVCGEQAGADDNASGVAGLLELTRALKAMESSLSMQVELVAYTLEEPPYFRTSSMGSAVHAQSLVDAKADVRLMISLEMIGYFSDKPGSQRFPSTLLSMLYPSVGNFIAVVGNWTVKGLEAVRTLKAHMAPASDVPVYSINGPSSIPGLDFSDHLNYWAHGIPAVMVTDTSFFRNGNYHKASDTIETLDFARMAQVVRGVAWAVMKFK